MEEILRVETARVRVSVSGARIASPQAATRIVAHRGAAEWRTAGARGRAEPDGRAPLAVPEEAVLSVLVQSRTGDRMDVAHRDPGQTAGLAHADGGHVLHGSVRVRDAVGVSTFHLRVGGTPELAIALAVVPTKLSAQKVRTMRADVEAAWRGAALSASGAGMEAVSPEGESSRPAWVAVLRYAVRALQGPLAEIARRPEVKLVSREHAMPLARLRGDARGVRAIRRGRGVGGWESVGEHAARSVVRAPVLRASYDTAAHRWLRQRLDAARRTLLEIRREEASHPYAERGQRRAFRGELDALDAALGRHAQTGPLAEAHGVRARAPLALRRRPAYRQAYDAVRMLEHGLSVARGEVETAWLGTAALYETWCALRVVRAAAQAIGAEPPEAPFGSTASGARTRVGRGKERSVVLRGCSAEVEIVYEPRFGAPPALLAQRPDLLVVLRCSGRAPVRAVLDAKYRRDDSAAYVRRHGAPGPPEDAIGDLHRYRDAIVGRDGAPLVSRAAALYPFHGGPGFESSRLWRAHAEVGIGAVPLAPGATGWLARWVATWLRDHGLEPVP